MCSSQTIRCSAYTKACLIAGRTTVEQCSAVAVIKDLYEFIAEESTKYIIHIHLDTSDSIRLWLADCCFAVISVDGVHGLLGNFSDRDCLIIVFLIEIVLKFSQNNNPQAVTLANDSKPFYGRMRKINGTRHKINLYITELHS